MGFGLFITNSTIIDGTGRSRFRADLVLFDAATVAHNATLKQPDTPPDGIRAVLIGGQVMAWEVRMVRKGQRSQVLRC